MTPQASPLSHPIIDVHGHLLPGVDDGSRDLAESIELAAALVAAGFSHFTCTPHIWPGAVLSPAFVTERTMQLQHSLDQAGVRLTLIPGGELNIDLPLESMGDDEIVSYSMRGKYVLFDFWYSHLPDMFWPRVKRLQRMGLTPIVAHPERIGVFQRDTAALRQVREAGLLLQLNAYCLVDPEGSPTRRVAERLLDEDAYFLIGSDLHQRGGLDQRLRGLEAARRKLSPATFKAMTHDNPKRVLGLD
jgi:protein-tyrosine phosphatase